MWIFGLGSPCDNSEKCHKMSLNHDLWRKMIQKRVDLLVLDQYNVV